MSNHIAQSVAILEADHAKLRAALHRIAFADRPANAEPTALKFWREARAAFNIEDEASK